MFCFRARDQNSNLGQSLTNSGLLVPENESEKTDHCKYTIQIKVICSLLLYG